MGGVVIGKWSKGDCELGVEGERSGGVMRCAGLIMREILPSLGIFVQGNFVLVNERVSCDLMKVVVSDALNAVAVRLPPE